MFEEGEKYFNIDRIVRIGSHTGPNRLHDRIDEHFIEPNHRDSVFRKHLGRCFLRIEKLKEYIPIWDLECKSTEDKEQNFKIIDWEFEASYDEKITNYIKDKFSFVIIPDLVDKTLRCRLEKALIATLAKSTEKISSKEWLGLYHPNQNISSFKLWNIHHLKGKTLSLVELNILKNKVG